MNNRGYIKPLIAIGAALLLSHCSLLENAIKKPDVAFDTIKFNSFSKDQLDLSALVQVTNPNSYGIAVDSVSYQLIINDKALLKNQSEDIGGLPANGKKQLALPLTLSGETISSFKALMQQEKIDYTIAGSVKVLGISLPFSEDGTWYRPSFSVEKVNIKEASLSKVALTLRLSIDNPNDTNIPIKGINYQVASHNTVLSTGAINDTNIDKGKTTIDIPVSFAPKELASSLFKLMQNPVLPLSFTVQTPMQTITHDYSINLGNVYKL